MQSSHCPISILSTGEKVENEKLFMDDRVVPTKRNNNKKKRRTSKENE